MTIMTHSIKRAAIASIIAMLIMSAIGVFATICAINTGTIPDSATPLYAYWLITFTIPLVLSIGVLLITYKGER